MKGTIFYSWQSDLPNSTNRSFIQEVLEAAVASLKQDGELTVEPVLDRDTAGVPGSPDIGQTIFGKIEAAAAMVADVSIINSGSQESRPAPNPNVLIELGYAFKAIGYSNVIMVMNTAFGKPDLLPFDLKQKRVATYALPEKSPTKTDVKKQLTGTLTAALKSVLTEHEQIAKAKIPKPPSLSEVLIEAVRQNRPDQARLAQAYMRWLTDQLALLQPKDKPHQIDDDALVQAIEKAIPFVADYNSVVDVIASMDAQQAAKGVFKGFENILPRYYLPSGFSGTYNRTDFDFFKFIGHELFVTLTAALMRDGRQQTLDEILSEQLYVSNRSEGHQLLGWTELSEHLMSLDEIRNKRLAGGGQRRLSIHADILKERHTSDVLAVHMPWTEFMDGDAFLYLRSLEAASDFTDWWPRTAVYLQSHTPRFLIEATSTQGARRLASALKLKTREELVGRINAGMDRLNGGLRQMGAFGGRVFEGFRVDTIGTF